ncbi:MAG: hypothetical protein ACRDAU_16855 [Clostridium sp.]
MFEHTSEECSCLFCKLVHEYNIEVEKYDDDSSYFIDYDIDYNTEEDDIQYDDIKINEKYRQYMEFSVIVDNISIPFIETLYSINKAMTGISYSNSNFKLNYIFAKIKEGYLYSYSNFEIGIKERIQRDGEKIGISEEKIKNQLYDKSKVEEVAKIGKELDEQFRKERNIMGHELSNQSWKSLEKVPLSSYISYLELVLKVKKCIEASIEIYDMTEQVDEIDDVVYRNIMTKKKNYFKVIDELINSILVNLENNMELLVSRDCRDTVWQLFNCENIAKKLEKRKNCSIKNNRVYYYNDYEKNIYNKEDIEYKDFVIDLSNHCKEYKLKELRKKYDLTREEMNSVMSEKRKTGIRMIEVYIDELYKIYKKKQILKKEEINKDLLKYKDNKMKKIMEDCITKSELSKIDSRKFWSKFRNNTVIPIISGLFEKNYKNDIDPSDEEIELIKIFKESDEDDYREIPIIKIEEKLNSDTNEK